MNSVRDTALKRWVAPFGNSGINDRSHLPRTYRSVPRPSSPLDAKAFTRCPSLPHHHPTPATGPDELTLKINQPNPSLGCRAPPAPWRESRQVSPQTLSIPCVPNRTTSQPPGSENQNSCPTARRSHSQGKHHTMTNSIPSKANTLRETIVAGTGLSPVPGPWSTSSQNISWHRHHPEKGQWWARADSNGRPHPYQGCALTD